MNLLIFYNCKMKRKTKEICIKKNEIEKIKKIKKYYFMKRNEMIYLTNF